MKPISILNEVLGPVMRGPSSSHTAAPYHLGRLVRDLLGGEPAAATFTFDPRGSWAEVYREQGSDLGFAAGLMGWSLTDERFPQALECAAAQGLDLSFQVAPLPEADHPNTVGIHLVSNMGREFHAVGQSIGGGAVFITRLEDWPLDLGGDAYEVLVEVEEGAEPTVRAWLAQEEGVMGAVRCQAQGERRLLRARFYLPPRPELVPQLEGLAGVRRLWLASPVVFPRRGEPLFATTAAMVALAEEWECSLGRVALQYEATLLGWSKEEVQAEILHRFEVMRQSVHQGLSRELPPMQLLQPSAGAILAAEAAGRLALGGLPTRAAARAMAVMHVNSSMGVVCAAPTAGSAGTLPGVIVTMAEEWGLTAEQTALALLAAAAVGLIVAQRATFAAEVAGCQVEIGAAGAMAAAAVVEAVGGTARQAADAAAIAFQNTMGSVCDLVQGIVEIPCHTRNAAAAASAFLCADLVLGGYSNPIPLDETVDAVYAVGQMLPRELKVTALGGLALAPSAQALPRLRPNRAGPCPLSSVCQKDNQTGTRI